MAVNSKLLDITPPAEQKLAEILGGQAGSMLRVAVTAGADGGVQYSLALEEHSTENDVVVEVGDLKLVVEATDAPLIQGAQIDYVEGLMRSGFVISSPNMAAGGHGCACGGGGCGCGGY